MKYTTQVANKKIWEIIGEMDITLDSQQWAILRRALKEAYSCGVSDGAASYDPLEVVTNALK